MQCRGVVQRSDTMQCSRYSTIKRGHWHLVKETKHTITRKHAVKDIREYLGRFPAMSSNIYYQRVMITFTKTDKFVSTKDNNIVGALAQDMS